MAPSCRYRFAHSTFSSTMLEQPNAKIVIWAFLLPSSQIISSDAALPLALRWLAAQHKQGGAGFYSSHIVLKVCRPRKMWF